MNRDEYRAYEKACRTEFEASQWETAELTLFERQLDFPASRVVLFDQTQPIAEALLTLIGSHGVKSDTWVWGWANRSADDEDRAGSDTLRELASETGNEEFATGTLQSIDAMRAWGLAAVAWKHLEARGIYREFANDSDWFFTIDDVRFLEPPESIAKRASTTLHEAIVGQRWVPEPTPQDLTAYTRVRDPRGLQTRTTSLEARVINMVRRRFPDLRLSLIGADLRGAALPWSNDLHVQLLRDMGAPSHAVRDLVGVDFSGTRLDGAILRGVLLSDASFEGASLVDADFSGADLNGASLRNAFLNGSNFTRAPMTGADFTGSEFSRTMLTSVDISEVIGLESVHHVTPSEISFSTLVRSRFQVSAAFLRQAGVSRGLLEDLAKGQRFPGRFQTCFLSYSSKDAAFAEKLYASLTEAGIRVFWDRFDVIPGERLEDQIAEAIRELDRLLVVLSPHSMASDWVKKEILMAWYARRESLLPVRLVPIEEIDGWTAADEQMPDLGEEFPIQDFSGWQDEHSYEHAFSLLRRAFSGGVAVKPPSTPTG